MAEIAPIEDSYLKSVIASKGSTAVIKVNFATFASGVPQPLKIFAYEGVNDKSVYYHWISRIRADLKYEPFECNNKSNVLRLFDLLEQDLTGLGDRVYYFVDKDYDDLQGRQKNNKIYLTCKYSIENYFVTSEVLEDILKIEFHCNGHAPLRTNVISKFELVYKQFLSVTRDINFRIFLARKLNIRQIEDLPTKINQIANVSLHEVSGTGITPSDIVRLEREPTVDEVQKLLPAFEALDSINDYRGKFAFLFFVKWLSLLRADRADDEPTVFIGIPKSESNINGSFTIGSIAPKTKPPAGLHEFIVAV